MSSAHQPPLAAPFAGLILAGGMGERWGGPKAWARLPDGRSFLDACAQTLGTAGATHMLATVPAGTLKRCHTAAAELLELPRPGLDMLASARHGMARLLETDTDWQALIILPVDHPLVRPPTVSALVAAGPPAAIPCLDGRHGHPICLWRDVVERLCTGLLPADNLRDVLKAAPAQDVAVNDPGVRVNCNRPEILQEALAQLQHLPPI